MTVSTCTVAHISNLIVALIVLVNRALYINCINCINYINLYHVFGLLCMDWNDDGSGRLGLEVTVTTPSPPIRRFRLSIFKGKVQSCGGAGLGGVTANSLA